MGWNENYCVAHRGWSAKAPENTLAAIRLAMSEPYVQWLEVDVQLSKDGVPVIIHDFSLERTTNGRGLVREKTFAELRELDAGSWFSKTYAGESIPTLEEVLNATVGRLRLNIELKTVGDMYPGLEEKVIDHVYRYTLQHDVCLTSFEPKVVQRLKKLAPQLRVGLIYESPSEDYVGICRALGADFLSLDYKWFNQRNTAELYHHGIGMMAWTCNHTKDIIHTASLHPDLMICTNYPDRWREALGEGKS
ncbi:glycerophosphodiester phosphodiesterase [Paenibacillus selenitireducens]|uniref:Glycerophosphodiester phosphodiesterase n=1 Tax=Paenibacillus selenitireducens TaxID=1324314 RepID=A0A1T2XMS2_9BACL|nr:glycerophosphodiester phosphodiesterase family protein [Paenibacillus selenitireducens]OPA81105.1 glycerophosphodiester phosphodiesterase [Paenibacillus selenitireducens]